MLKILRININNLRFYSIKHAPKKPPKYTDTINLPKTKFPNRITAINRDEVEQQLLKGAFSSAYRYQESHNAEPTFVLHDGPPYANGDLHMGHAVNKILKDITLRQHAIKGQKVHYVPGWDCHGLPIELKAMTKGKERDESKQDALTIRKKSRQFALSAIERQKAEFRAWGVLSDWQDFNHAYLTFKPDFIINQLNMFWQLYEKGLVYRDLKPVFWSPSSRTALAEAELEYDPDFVSPSVYLRLELMNLPGSVTKANRKLYALVWTTTPWTLPSNQAICYNSALNYVLVKFQKNNNSTKEELYLMAANLVKDFENTTGQKCEIVQSIKGTELAGCSYQHPIDRDQASASLPFLAAQHVQDTKGTGLVHTAPAHGPDDFLVSLDHRLTVKSYVNEKGVYTAEAPTFLRGKQVLQEGDNLVLEHIAKDVVFSGKLTHAYPIDWRTKQPVIIRASEQWFINTNALKERASKEINKIEIYPRANAEASKKALRTQVQKRPYWCISRQRVWGVPIPVFFEKHTGKVVTNKELIKYICDLISQEGNIDFWWSRSVEEILPPKVQIALNLRADMLVKGADIFDIWFDSGSTWSSVLPGAKVADLYLEGYDQFTGWFQSSLMMSLAARDCAPYKALFVHGFTVDEKGHKMSKSLGNVISPKQVTKKYGVDTLRWWVASHGTQNMAITVSDNLLQQAAENVSKIRATLRYLNGAIGCNTTKTNAELPSKKQTYLNRYLLSSLVNFEAELEKYYKGYEYNRVVALIQNFVVNQISAVYVHLVKDRLYCGDNKDLEDIQFTLTQCYRVLCKALWPIAPFLVEESWSYYDATAPFHQQNVKSNAEWKDEQVELVLNAALDVKRILNQKASDVNTWTLAVNICCSNTASYKLLQQLQPASNACVTNSELCEILQTGSVSLKSSSSGGPQDYTVDIEPLHATLCPRCRRFAIKGDDTVCMRCENVLSTK